MPDRIPVVDVSALSSPDRGARVAVAAELGAACRGYGFFVLTGHGVPTALIDAAFAAGRRFFASPEPVKAAVAYDVVGANRGWIGLGRERLDVTAAPDRKEAFNIGWDLPADDPEIRAGVPFRAPNAWPDVPGFRDTLLAYYAAVHALGIRLHLGFSIDLGLAREDHFTASLDRPIATLRLLRYPAADGDDPGGIGAGEHTDYGNVTLLATDGVAGLEVRTRDGRWIEPPPTPGAFVVNIGDCLMRWTNDVYVSTPHRVRVPRTERHSIAFFLDPNPDAEVAVLPECVAPDRPARYPPTTGTDFLRARLEPTYAHAAAG